jgi:urease accessory protein
VARAAGHVPYAPRAAPAPPGWARVVLVQTVAGPLGGDRLELDVDVAAGARLLLQTNAATVALPGEGPACQRLRFRLGRCARLAWLPEPLVLAGGCDLRTRTELELAEEAAALVGELVVLGRHGEPSGALRATLRCEQAGRLLLHDEVTVDAAVGSPAVLGDARAVGSLALLGLALPLDPDELALAGPGRLLRVSGRDAAALRRRLDAAAAAAQSSSAW